MATNKKSADDFLSSPPTKSADAFLEGPNQPQQEATTFMQGLTTNYPTKGITALVGRGSLPAIGGALGAAGGTVLGMGVGAIPSSAIGGASGEAVRQTIVSATNPEQNSTGQVLGNVAASGATEAIGTSAMKLGGMAVNKLAPNLVPGLVKLGGQIEHATTGVAERFGQNIWKRGKQVSEALPEEASPMYQAAMGELKGLGDYIRGNILKGGERDITVGHVKTVFEKAANALDSGTLTPQEALAGVQAVNRLQVNAESQSAERVVRAYNVPEWAKYEQRFKDFLEEKGFPIKKASQDYFDSLTKSAYGSIMPLKQNMSANALRGLIAVGGAGKTAWNLATQGTGDKGESLAPLAAPLAVSPFAHYLTIRAAQSALPYVTGMATRLGLESVSPRPNSQTPVAPANNDQFMKNYNRLKSRGYGGNLR